eukprot:CAMPEP_0202774096 /NCGR_PEP_ID=MMETSP1388-20130828/45797_1 /ASSEMBLY_ACC=CAM_ASM_000864 /TAXON_ID=37098 /ORGANISM="Isochrysis sp, Strain CCMP1244" /LENGTH=504 /DNA_ID=CAMNT_0049443145 /DNA_START=36 /DNA_END=1551 /DNA_ORIENTATION=-
MTRKPDSQAGMGGLRRTGGLHAYPDAGNAILRPPRLPGSAGWDAWAPLPVHRSVAELPTASADERAAALRRYNLPASEGGKGGELAALSAFLAANPKVMLGERRTAPTPFSVMLYVLSMDKEPFRHNRLNQRTTLHAFGIVTARPFEVAPGHVLRLRYVLDATVPRSDAVQRELDLYGDLLWLPDSHTCLGKVLVAIRHSTTLSFPVDAIAFTDDDAFLHPGRFLDQLAEAKHAAGGSFDYAYYGHLSWASCWDAKRQRHWGYGNDPVAVLKSVDEWQTARRCAGGRGVAQGPYPFAVMHNSALGVRVARRIAAAVSPGSNHSVLRGLMRHLERKPTTERCDPEPDSGLGYIVSQLGLPIVWADTTSAQRNHFWRSKATPLFLRSSLAVLHKAIDWQEHFRWALCGSAVEPLEWETSRAMECYPSRQCFGLWCVPGRHGGTWRRARPEQLPQVLARSLDTEGGLWCVAVGQAGTRRREEPPASTRAGATRRGLSPSDGRGGVGY